MGSAYGAKRTRESIDARVSRLASSQYGVFSRAQAIGNGGTKSAIRRRVEAGRWQQLTPGVYRVAGSPSSWRQKLLAECMAWGDEAVASHCSAAALWMLAGFERVTVIEITVARTRSRRNSRHVVHWLSPLTAAETTILEAIPVTTPTRTIIDIASVSSRETLEIALDDALRRRITSIPRLQWQLKESARGRPGIVILRSLIDARSGSAAIPQSVFETRVLRILKGTGLPKPELQYHIREGPKVVAIVDFAFPTLRLAIEADGYRWHSGRLRWEHDLARRNALTSMGWRVLHITWSALFDRPESVIRTIEQAARANEMP